MILRQAGRTVAVAHQLPGHHTQELEDFPQNRSNHTGAPKNQHSGLLLFNLELQRAETYCPRVKGSQEHQTGGQGGSEIKSVLGHRLCRATWLSTIRRSGPG